jgi:hypothetical protein
MASTYVNDLRLNEMATGDGSGTWGTTTNTNLELIAEAFSYGTEVITTNADTHTTTIADGATDPGRSLYLKYTGTLDSACTITIGPNTVSKVWIIENGTSGSQNIILSQGSGANITIPAGDTKVVYSDGAGAGAAFVDAFASLSVVDLKVQDDLTVTDAALVTGVLTTTATQVATGGITSGSDIISDTDSTDSLGSTGVRWLKGWFDTLTAGTLTVGSGSVTDSSGAISFGDENLTTTGIVTAAGTSVFTNLDISGDVDVDGTTNLDVVDIDGAVDMASTLTVTGAITGSSAAFTQTNTLVSPVSARYDGSNKKIAFNINNSNGQGFIASNSNSTNASENQTYDINNTAAKIDFGLGVAIDTAVSGTAGNTISYVNNVDFLPTGTVFNEGGADLDFRVESDTFTGALTVDGADGHTTIGSGRFSIGAGTARSEFISERSAPSGTTITSIISIGNANAMSSAAGAACTIYGSDNAGKVFMDVVHYKANSGFVVISSSSLEGAPHSRTYVVAGNVLRVTMGAGASGYAINTSAQVLQYPF